MDLCDPAGTAPPALHRLRPRPAPSVTAVVRRVEVAPWEWTGLHLDGVLVPLWRDVARVATVAEDPALRALAFAELVPARAAVGRLSAAWVHTGGTPPARVTVLVRSAARRPEPHPDRESAEADLLDDDLRVIGGVRVTSVARTAVDVARWVPTPAAVPVLRALLPCGWDPDDTQRRLAAHPRGRGLRTARATLHQV